MATNNNRAEVECRRCVANESHLVKPRFLVTENSGARLGALEPEPRG